jgi:hypothetical protein
LTQSGTTIRFSFATLIDIAYLEQPKGVPIVDSFPRRSFQVFKLEKSSPARHQDLVSKTKEHPTQRSQSTMMNKIHTIGLISLLCTLHFSQSFTAPRAAVRLSKTFQHSSRLHVSVIDDTVAKAFADEGEEHFLGKPVPYSEITIGVMTETLEGETRVSQTPESVANLVKAGFQVVVQSGGTYRRRHEEGT